MNFSSVRLQLTLWSVGILAFVLLVFGISLRYLVQASLLVTIDRSLVERLHPMESLDPPPPMRLGPHDPPPDSDRDSANFRPPGGEDGNGPPQDDRPPRNDDTPQVPGDDGQSGVDHRPPRPAPWMLRNANIRFTDLSGHTIGQNAPAPFDSKLYVQSVNGKSVFVTRLINGVPTRIYSIPTRKHGQIAGVGQTQIPLTDLNRQVDHLTHILLFMLPAALLIAGLGGAFLTTRALRPVRTLQQAAERIGAGSDLSRRLPANGNDEFSELATTFNAMLARLEQAFLQQRRFTGDASHELRTPLSVIKMNTSLALRGQRTPDEYREALLAVDSAADRSSLLVQDLLMLAHADGGQLGRNLALVGIQDVIDTAMASITIADPPTIQQHLPTKALCVHGNAPQLVRLFTNLLENAIRHTPPSGHIAITAYAEGDSVVAKVADTGEGIPPEHLAHVCERFYRVDAARSRARAIGGNGLGLAICQEIVEAHKGTLTISSEVEKGTTVIILLPIAK